MNKKLLMYMMTGNIMFLILDTQTALMMSLMGGSNIFGSSGGTTASTGIQNLMSTPTGALVMATMMKGNSSRAYYRPRPVYINRRYYNYSRRRRY